METDTEQEENEESQSIVTADQENVEKPGKPLRVKKLNLKQELFCKLYASDREFFGNGVDSYVEAYNANTNNPNWYKVAQVSASKLLSNPMILARINELLPDLGFSDEFADKELSFVMTQKADFGAKISAIKEYNKLKQRIIEKTDITSKGKQIGNTIVKIMKYSDDASS